MPRRSLLAALALVGAFASQGFTSLPFYGAVHGDITREALAGMPARAIALVVEGDVLQDVEEMAPSFKPGTSWAVPTAAYEAAHHFDRNRGDTDRAAFARGVAYLNGARIEAAALLRAGRTEAGLVMLGRGLHGLQDFFSHSNYIDLAPGEQALIQGLLAGQGRPLPPGLRLTGYDRETGLDPVGDAFGHDAFSKDGPGRTPEAGRMIGERTKHEVAKAAAIEASRAFVSEVRAMAGEEAWERLKSL